MIEGIKRTLAAIEKWLLRDNSGKPVLCRTFLDPSDDPVEFPFLTYSNVLLWKAWMIASSVFKRLGGDYAHVADELLRDSKALEEAYTSLLCGGRSFRTDVCLGCRPEIHKKR